jgi:hypothetical protein
VTVAVGMTETKSENMSEPATSLRSGATGPYNGATSLRSGCSGRSVTQMALVKTGKMDEATVQSIPDDMWFAILPSVYPADPTALAAERKWFFEHTDDEKQKQRMKELQVSDCVRD